MMIFTSLRVSVRVRDGDRDSEGDSVLVFLENPHLR